MPTHDAHQRPTAATANPFEDNVPRLTEYTAQEIATLQCRLDRQLGPEYISTRPGAGGGKVHYLAAEKVINLANEVFGFNGWSSGIQNVQVDFVDENQSTGRISLGLSVIMRITLRDGTFHEDIGYGQIENCKGKAAAFEKAKKEAATDSLKRALRNFGNVLGNCLYDKDYLQKITKVKCHPSKWDADNLHRHVDFAPDKKETNANKTTNESGPLERRISNGTEIVEEEFGNDLFDEVEVNGVRPDEVLLPPSRPQTPKAPPVRIHSGTSAPPQSRPSYPASKPPYVPADVRDPNQDLPQPQIRPTASINAQQPQPQQQSSVTRPAHSTPPEQTRPQLQQPQPSPQQQVSKPHEPPVGFITSRAAELLRDQPPDASVATALPKFNPNADSPSIRKTSGIDHAKSAPVRRENLNGLPPSNNVHQANPAPKPQAQQVPTNFVNPSENMQRRIGAPGVAMSPHSNRSAYKPPTMAAGVKRPLPPQLDGAGNARQPLADVSNIAGQDISGEDAKKQRLAEG